MNPSTQTKSSPVSPVNPATSAKPKSLTWLWTLVVIFGAVVLLVVATFFALRIVADNAAHDYKQQLASYETSLAKSFNGSSADSSTLVSAVSTAQLPTVANVPLPAASPLYQQIEKQSDSVATTVTALKQSINDYATLSTFLNSYLDLENQENNLVTKITLNSTGITNIQSVQAIVVKKQALIQTTTLPSESTSVAGDLSKALTAKTTALAQLLTAAKNGSYSGFNTATAALNTASSQEEAALGTLDTQSGSLQDSINQNVTAFNSLVAKVVQ